MKASRPPAEAPTATTRGAVASAGTPADGGLSRRFKATCILLMQSSILDARSDRRRKTRPPIQLTMTPRLRIAGGASGVCSILHAFLTTRFNDPGRASVIDLAQSLVRRGIADFACRRHAS